MGIDYYSQLYFSDHWGELSSPILVFVRRQFV